MNTGFDGEWIPVVANMELKTERGESFDKVRLRSVGGRLSVPLTSRL